MEKKNERKSGTETTYKNYPTLRNPDILHIMKDRRANTDGTDFSKQKTTTKYKFAAEYAWIISFHRPSSIRSMTYQEFKL